MASINVKTGGDTGLANFQEFSRPVWVKLEITGAQVQAANGGTAIAAADTIELITIPAGFVVEGAVLDIVTADTGTTLTFDLGDNDQADRWVDGADVTTVGFAAAGTNGQTDEVRVYGATNQLRLTAVTAASANDDYVVRVLVKLANLRDGIGRAIPAVNNPNS